MGMDKTDRIIAAPRGTPAQAKAWAEERNAVLLDDVHAYIDEVFRLAPLVGIDPSLVIAQSAHETDDWDSFWWRERLNPAGIGITGNTAQNEASKTWENGTDAAQAQIAHLLLYAMGPSNAGIRWSHVPGMRYQVWIADPRYDAYFDAYGDTAQANTLNDLTGKWAEDQEYAPLIAAKGSAIFPNLPDQSAEETPPMAAITYGLVPRPPITDMICAKPFEGAGFTRVAPRQIVGACDHITDGNGTLQFYHDFFSTGGERARDALVDFVIDKQGKIAMLNDPYSTRAPWANGGSDGLEGDGPLFVRTLGVAAINSRLASIEHVGVSPAKMTDAQLQASAALKAWLFDRAHVPWDRFPFNPNVNCVTHLQHFEFATKPCPGSGIRAQTDDLQNRIRAIMKAAQTSTAQPTPVPPPTPVETDKEWFGRYKESELKARFSDLVRHNPDGSTTTFAFAPTGLITNSWIARAASENLDVGEIPTPDDWWLLRSQFTADIDVVTFGAKTWILERHSERDGFRWIV